jgi:hypothetical protein
MKDVMRIAYRPLTELEKLHMQGAKSLGADFYEYLEVALDEPGYDQRCIAMAKTKIEEAVMWATKAITA